MDICPTCHNPNCSMVDSFGTTPYELYHTLQTRLEAIEKVLVELSEGLRHPYNGLVPKRLEQALDQFKEQIHKG